MIIITNPVFLPFHVETKVCLTLTHHTTPLPIDTLALTVMLYDRYRLTSSYMHAKLDLYRNTAC